MQAAGWVDRRARDPQRGAAMHTLADWKCESDFLGVRDSDALAKLPEAERMA